MSLVIVIDTNVVAELFILPTTPLDQRRRDQSSALIRMIEQGEVDAWIPEVVIHECFYVLVMSRKILTVDQFALAFRSLLLYKGWAMEPQEIEVYRNALDIVAEHPRLEFSDAVIAARTQALNADLATFDIRLANLFGSPHWADS